MRIVFIAISFLLALPNFTHAMQITEIMYDLEGADAGREWIEIFNDGSDTIDLTDWVLLESGTNHGVSTDASASLGTGKYAIIADNPEKFLADHPGYAGIVLDSAFSLSNSGESIALIDPAGVTRDSLEYSSDMGATGDGNSLQRVAVEWSPAQPTPGAGPASSSISSPQDVGDNSGDQSPATSAPTRPHSPKTLEVQVPDDAVVVVGADTVLEGSAFGVADAPVINARYVWNFGDGGTDEGKRVLHAFAFPGEYSVILSVSSGEYSGTGRFTITAKPAEIEITHADAARIDIQNNGADEIELGHWYLEANGVTFSLPENTRIPPGKRLILAAGTTGISEITDLGLYYPDTRLAIAYSKVGVIADPVPTPVAVASPARVAPVVAAPPQAARPPEPTVTTAAPATTSDAAVAASTTPVIVSSSVAAAHSQASLSWPWYLGLFLILSAAVVAVLLRKSTVEGYEIVE